MAIYRETCMLGNFEVTIRNAEPEDAESMIAHIRQVDTESFFLAREPGEFTISVDEERKLVEGWKTSEYDLFLVADIAGQIVATCATTINPRKRYRHKATLMIAVQKPYWSMGIGRKMMNAVIAWCKEKRLTKIELSVDSENQRALSLYGSLGFEIEGTKKRDTRMQDGSYRNGHFMALFLE